MPPPPAASPWTKRRKVLACSILATLALPVAAAEKTWVSNTSGSWSTNANWLDGIVPPAGGDAALTLRFSPGGGANVTAVNDLGDFALNRLQLENQGSGLLTLSGNRLRLTGTAPMISLTGNGHTTISTETTLDPLSGDVTISGTGAGNLTITGPISQSGGSRRLVIAGQAPSVNAQVISLRGNSTFSGGLVLQSGNLALSGSAAAGTGPLVVNGGTLRFVGASAAGLTNAISLNSDLRVGDSETTSYVSLQGIIASSTPGTGVIFSATAAASFFTLGAPSTYTGVTRLDFSTTSTAAYNNAGTLQLSGSALGSSLFDIRAGGTLAIVGNDTGVANRIGDATPVELRSARLTYTASVGPAAQVETIGPLRVSGSSRVTVTPQSTLGARLTAHSLVRLDRGTVLIRGTGLGGSFGANVANVTFTNAPAMVGGGGTGLQTSIIPYAIGSNSTGGSGSGFLTYSATNGVRLLATGEFSGLPSSVTTINAQVTTNQTHNFTATVNSLALLGGSVSGSGTLTVTSGAVLNTTSGATLGKALNFGARDGIIFTIGALSISAPISGSDGLTKSGDSTLTLSAANPFTGQLTVNSGQILFSAPEQLGASNSAIVLNGQNAGLTYTAPTALTFPRGFTIASGIGHLQSTGGGTLELSGAITGSGGLRLSTGAGSKLALTGSNGFTGPVFFTGGQVALGSDAALGAGEMNLDATTLQLLAPWNAARTVRVNGAATLDTANFDANWSGLLLGTGALTKIGTGTLTIGNAGPYSGAVAVNAGTLRLSGTTPLSSASYQAGPGTRLTLDRSAAASGNQINDTAAITLRGSELAFSGNAAADVSEAVGTITLPADGPGGLITLTAGGNFGATLRAANLSPIQSLLVRGEHLGGASGGGFTRLVVTGPLTSAGGILRGIFAQETTPAGPITLAVNDANSDAAGLIGVRPLRADEQTIAAEIRNPANGGTTPAAAHFVAGTGTTVVGLENMLGSLTLESGGSVGLAGTQRISLSASALLARAGAGVASIPGGTLDFGAVPAMIATFGDLMLGSAIAGSGGLEKLGHGTLILGGSPAFSGPTSIREGVLRLGENSWAAQAIAIGSPGVLELGGSATTVGTLTGTGDVRLGGNALTLGARGEDMTFAGRFSGAGSITIVDGGNPTAVRTFTGSSPFTGGVTLVSGHLRLTPANPFSSATITVDGGSLSVTQNAGLNSAFVLNTNLRLEGTSTLTLTTAASTTGAGGIVLGDSGALIVETAAAHTGETAIALDWNERATGNPTKITLRGATGALTSTSALRIGPAGSLDVLNDTVFAGPPGGRIADAATVSLSSSFLYLGGAATGSTVETIGPLRGRGYNTVIVSPGASASARLAASSLIRDDRATWLFRAPGLGSPLANGVGGITFAANLAGDLVGAGGVGTRRSILPYAIGDGSVTGLGSGLVTYDPVNGIRLLNPATEYATTLPTTAGDNVRLTAAASVSSPVTVNSLLLEAGAINGAGTLSLVSGVLLKNYNGYLSISANLAFGSAEAQIYVPGNAVGMISDSSRLVLTGALTGNNGLTKSGLYDLVLGGSNQITGPLTINGGNVSFSTLAQLGSDPSPVRFSGELYGSGLLYTGSSAITITRPLETLAGYAALRTSAGSAIFEVAGAISGEGGLRITGDGYVRLSAANTYRGPTVITGGLILPSDAALGDGGLVELLGNSTPIRLAGNWNSDRRILATGSGRIALDGYDASWAGPVEGPVSGDASLVIAGPGAFTWTASSPFSGSIFLREAADWRLSADGSVRTRALEVGIGTEATVDNRQIALTDRLADNVAISISGNLTLHGSDAQAISEQVGTLTLSSGTLAPAVTLRSPGSFPTVLDAYSLVVDALAPAVISGDQLGGAAGGLTRLTFRTPPILKGGLIPRLFVENPATSAPDSFALYDTSVDAAGVIGVRSLRSGDYTGGPVIRNPLNGGNTSTEANVLIESAVSAGGTANTINSITLAGGGVLSLGTSQTLGVAVPALLAQAGASARIEGGALLLGATAIAIAYGDVALHSRLAGTTTLEKYGPGRLTLLPSAFANTLVIHEGVTRFVAPGPFSLASATVRPGATLDFNGLEGSLATATIDGTLALGAGAWHQRGSGNVTGAITGSGDVWLHQGQLNITSPAAYTGGTFVEPAPGLNTPVTLALTGRGSLLASSHISLIGAVRLSLSNLSSPAALPRIGVVPVTLNGSILVLTGNPTTPTAQDAGPLTGIGFSVINLASGGTPSTQLRFTELVRSERATFGFSGVHGLATGSGATNLFFDPALASALSGAGTTATNTPILPFALHDFDGSLIATRPTLVTYSPLTGIRPLNLTTEYTSSLVTGANVRLTSTVVQDVPVTVNALVFDNSGIAGAGTIGVNSGAVVAGRITTIANPLAFASAEANLFVANSVLQLDGPISGSGGLTITGTRRATLGVQDTLRLFGENTFTGPITVNGGGLIFQRLANLGPDTSQIVLNDANLTFSRVGAQTPVTLTRPIRVTGRFGEFSGDPQFFFAGPISGPGGLSVRNVVTLTGANTYLGPTILNGDLRFTSDDALGLNPMILLKSGSRITLLQPWSTSRRLEFADGGTLYFDSNGFDAEVRGGMVSDGVTVQSFQKWGAGTLRISGAMAFYNDIRVYEGALALDGVLGTSSTSTLSVSAGATFTGEAQLLRTLDISGTLAPGNGPGAMATGDLEFQTGSKLALELVSVAAFDHIDLTGTLTLFGNAELQLSLQFDPADGIDRFKVIDNDGSDPVSFSSGARFVFAGNPLDEGERFTAGTQEFQITYTGGDGNDVELRATPEPGSLALLASGSALGLRRRRRSGVQAR